MEEAIKLISPTPEHRRAAEKFKQAFFDRGEMVINGSALLDQMEYAQWLENTRNNSCPETVRADWVVASTRFAIRERDDSIIGMVDIRHNLNNEFLTRYGGHIGYSVRPDERGKGYATNILRQALDSARVLGLSEVMLGCCSDNIGSKKTIEKCGGKLTETKFHPGGKRIDIYWIVL